MTTVDRLIQEAIKDPSDSVVRAALADALREAGDPELADAVEADMGRDLLANTAASGRSLRLPPSARLLWYQYAVVPRVPPIMSMNWPIRPAASGVIPGWDVGSRPAIPTPEGTRADNVRDDGHTTVSGVDDE